MFSELLIADEVAEILRVDRQRVYDLVRSNSIPVIKLGKRQYRFSRTAIERWVENGGNEKNGNDSDERI